MHRLKRLSFLSNINTQVKLASNSSLPGEADVVIIGGGIAGCSTLYQLSKRGVKAVLLERSKLTSGTTWHTAGLVWSLRPNDVEVQLLATSRNVYGGLETETGEPSGWINNGGLFISHSQVRTDEYTRLATLGNAFGIKSEILDGTETHKRWPLLEAKSIFTTLYSPADGTVDPAMACTALTRVAKQNGSQYFENTPVLQIETGANSLGNLEIKNVITARGNIKTKCVVNCSGAWSNKISKLVGSSLLPIVPMKHAYVVTQTIPGVRNMPNVRDHDDSFYFRIQGDSICMGGYEGNPIILDKGVPENFEFQLYELDWSIFSTHIDGASALCPAFAKAGIKSTVCGPESFTPDHKPLLGEDQNIYGLYHNCGYNSAGMMFSPGCAEQMADWIIKGRPSLPMFTFDVRRFTKTQLNSNRWNNERSHEAYARNYDLVFPQDEHLGGRGVQLSPAHQTLISAGAIMQARAGWERPAFYLDKEIIPVPAYDWGGHYGHARNSDLRYEDVLKGDYTFGFSKYHNLIGAEALQCRNEAALFDMSYYGKFYLSGVDAQKAANLIFTADTEKVPNNKLIYSCVLNDNGGVEADLTVSVIDNGGGKFHEPTFQGKGFYVVTSGFSAQHTFCHMKKIMNTNKLNAQVIDVTSQLGIISLQGPKSREILQNISNLSLNNEEFPVSTHNLINVDGVGECRALRVGWAGELGWELHTSANLIPGLIKKLKNIQGWKYAGWRALTSLSAEKGYHLWNTDIRLDDSPIEAGLGFTCRKNGNFVGKKYIDAQRENGVFKKYAFFTLDVQKPLFGLETVYRNGKVCGFLRRGDYGYHINKPIGVAYITDNEKNTPITAEYLKDGEYEIESLGNKYSATIHLKSPFDPKNQRILGNYN